MRISDWSSDVCSSDLVGAGDLLAVDAGRAAVLGHVAYFALGRDLQVEAVAGHHHARELGVVDLDQVRQPARRAAAAGELGEDAAGLGQRLDHQHAGITGLSGKWPWKNASLALTFL